MLSYQHGFHAGNFADVHKHTALCLILDQFKENKKIITHMDSHSGRGLYDLEGEQANKTSEWKDGFGRLKECSSKGLTLYRESIQAFQVDHSPTIYPGSPALTKQLMADNHRAILFELHPTEFDHLKENLGDDKRLRLVKEDAQEKLIDYLPGRKAEGLLLIDPAYEIKDEYASIPKLATSSHKRWPSGVVVVWYPMLPEGRHEDLKAKLKGATFYELVGPEKERGMYGTGLAVLNAPDGFDATFKEAEDEMREILFS